MDGTTTATNLGTRSRRAFRLLPTETSTFYPRVFGRRGVVASEHYLSAGAAIEILKVGGNAIDAAVAATLVEGVVNPQMHTIGGELPILICREGDARPTVINGNMMAPAAATPEAFRTRGHDKIPPEGVLAAGVPGAPGALIVALKHFGTMSFSQVVEPALDLARNGFAAHPGLIRQHKFGIAANREKFLTQWLGSAAQYLNDGALPLEGAPIRNPALADMFEYLTRAERSASSRNDGLDAVFRAFYRGDVAAAIVAHVERGDGLLAREDFDAFEVPIEAPFSVSFAGADVYKCGPWTQGPALLQALTILRNFDLSALGHNSVEYVHIVTEAIKLAFADREQFYADPLHVEVPMAGLLAEEYGAARAELIGEHADTSLRPGDPWAHQPLLDPSARVDAAAWGHGTVHVDVMDEAGNSAAFTPSGAWIMQSEVMPALGFPLGVRLANCHLGPSNHPNIVAPHKRPRTTISPSMVMRDGHCRLAFGSMGGDQQDQWQLQFLLNRLVFDMPLQTAIEAPKFSSEHFPGFFHPQDMFLKRLRIEESVGSAVLAGLAAKGHDLDVGPAWSEGFLCATERHATTGMLECGVDPRGTKAEVFPAAAMAF